MADQHQESISRIEAETAEIRRQMSQYELLAKKEEVERKKELDQMRRESEIRNEKIEKHLRHLSSLAGITFEQLDELDYRLQSASVSLAKKIKS